MISEKGIAIAKDLLALLRDGVLVLLFILLLVAPGFVADRLITAGFEEGEFVGFKWKKDATRFGASVQKLAEELKQAKATIEQQTALLKVNETEIARLRQEATSAEEARRLAELEARNKALASQAAAQTGAISSTLVTARPVVARAREIATVAGPQAVILGSDTTLEAAEYEVKQAQKAQIAGAQIYRKGNLYVTAAVTSDRAVAEAWLARGRQRRPDAVIVRFASWCPAPQINGGYTQC